MKKLLLLLFVPLFSFSQIDIVGGEDADILDYPWQVALIESSGGWSWAFCGGSIIDNYWILTAAHCLEDVNENNLYVMAGSDNSYAQGGDSYSVEEIIVHPNYNNNTMNNDIALLKLNNPIYFNSYKQSVMLICDEQVSMGAQSPGTMATITGWGETETNNYNGTLQVASVPITTTSNYGWGQIDGDMIMAGYSSGGYDSCQGDSGGPMVARDIDDTEWMQVGIVSWGYGCAEPGYPGVYTRVSYFLEWICENTNGDVCANEYEFCNSPIYGCTDMSACNYSSGATENDESCVYPIEYYDCNFICINDVDNDGICDELEILGCADFEACNYDSSATEDDSSCIYAETALDCDGNCIEVNTEIQICNCTENEIVNTWSEYNPSLCTMFYLCACECINDQNNNGICDEDESNVFSQQIELNTGWNIWSTYINPENPSFESAFSIITNDVIIIKDQNGDVYWPEYALNSIGSLIQGEGYQVKMENNNTLLLEGSLTPYNYELNIESGWNIMGYLHQEYMNAEEAVNSIIESIIIIKDEDGNVYWPEFGLNSINNMKPGEGYQIKLENPVNFSFPYLETSQFYIEDFSVTSNFQNPTNTGRNMTLGILSDAWPESPVLGDEIIITDQNNLIVGKSHYTDIITAITIWGNDELTEEKDGLYINEKFYIKIWSKKENIFKNIDVLNWVGGHNIYMHNAISLAGQIILSQDNSPKIKLVKITDVVGREISSNKKGFNIEIYDDGSVKKKYVIE